ncbi:MAG: hypothetical protein IT377_16230 [Polyangiaceae bacterium]|nr:hypothetical protein [Polyangiaceae bacterium]
MRRALVGIVVAGFVSSTRAGAQTPPAEPPPPPAPTPAPQAPAPAPTSAPAPYVAPAYPAPGPAAPAGAYPPAYPPPGVYVAAPPAPPPPPREEDEPGHHLHDGFYLRMSLGAGWLSLALDADPEATLKGAGGGLDLMLGGTPVDGLVIGGGVFSASVTDPRVESGGKSSDLSGQASLTVLGPFVDGFFDPKGGLHVGGAVGLATAKVEPDDSDSGFDEKPYNGAGLALFAGYDAWVSANWSLGGTVRLVAARGTREVDVDGETRERKSRAYGFSILFSALYH